MRNVPDPGFAGDVGEADPQLSAALASYATDPVGGHISTLAVLQGRRLLVPVMAVLGEEAYDERGLVRDKTSDMATVLMQGQDGRLAQLAFTSTASMRAWNPEARPVPVTGTLVAQAALHNTASAVVVDVAGPVVFVVEEAELRFLADGYTLVETEGSRRWARTV
ncbi:MAG: SseB family protein [Actinomycetota bacterium]|nr:SseB family protein [Actinomycetota bacterium]